MHLYAYVIFNFTVTCDNCPEVPTEAPACVDDADGTLAARGANCGLGKANYGCDFDIAPLSDGAIAPGTVFLRDICPVSFCLVQKHFHFKNNPNLALYIHI